jgi:hypothetical protein
LGFKKKVKAELIGTKHVVKIPNILRVHCSQFNKIVQRFYETPEGLSSGSNKRKSKIPIPAAPQAGFPLRSNKLATGYFGIFTTAHRAVVPHFRFKKDLILYLNSSRAAPKVGISVSLQQAAGNSNSKIRAQDNIKRKAANPLNGLTAFTYEQKTCF